MGDEKQQQLSLRGLQNAAGFLQSKIASRIETRHTPRLQFVIDKGIQNSLLVGEILAKNRQREGRSADAGQADAERMMRWRTPTQPTESHAAECAERRESKS